MAIKKTRIPDGLIPAVIDCIRDRIENLEDLIANDYFLTEEREAARRLINDLESVIAELDDPGSVNWMDNQN